MKRALTGIGFVLAVAGFAALAGCEQMVCKCDGDGNGDGNGSGSREKNGPTLIGTWTEEDRFVDGEVYLGGETLIFHADGTLDFRIQSNPETLYVGDGTWTRAGDVLRFEADFGRLIISRTRTITVLTDTRLCLLNEEATEPVDATKCYTRA